MASSLTLISHHLCPYVQRAVIALTEKQVSFDRVAVDLADKPDWFRAVSPLGRVPLLIVEGFTGRSVIFESNVILEYLEETQQNPLHPVDPLLRARDRSWIEFGSAMLNAIGRLYSASSQEAIAGEASGLAKNFDRIESELSTRSTGSWFSGDRFSLVDAVFAPIFRYFDTFDDLGDFSILAEMPLVGAWRQALAARPSVRGAVAVDYPERLAAFLRDRDSHLGVLARKKWPATALP